MPEASGEDRDNDVARGHEERPRDEDRPATGLVDPDDGGDGGEEHAANSRERSVCGSDVGQTYTIPTTPVARSELVLPVRPSSWKIVGA